MEEVEVKILGICKESICQKLIVLGACFVKDTREVNQVFESGEDGILIRLRSASNRHDKHMERRSLNCI